ncbi:MAG: CHAT domain-containing protein [Vulcanococcus sp.]
MSVVPAEQAVPAMASADESMASQTMEGLRAPDLAGRSSPDPAQLQGGMQAARRRFSGQPAGDAGPRSSRLEADPWLLAATTTDLPRAVLPPAFIRAAYNPAVLHISFTPAEGKTVSKGADAFLDITLVPPSGPVEGRRVEVASQDFGAQLRQLYAQLSRQDPPDIGNPASPSRRLHQLLLSGIAPLLERHRITSLLIAADRGLQAVPFAALSDGVRFFGDQYAFSLTPSLALTDLSLSEGGGDRLLALGASQFDGLAPLPLVPQELERVGVAARKDRYLNRDFTPATLLEAAADPRYSEVHVATHAEFKPGGPARSQLFSGTGPISMDQLASLRRQRKGNPLDLIVFSACRTAIGDPDSELGFAGLALQAGARSAIGTLWYVDDVVTSAYFVQMYRYLGQNMPKAEALQLTRQAFIRGLVRLQGRDVLGPDGSVLLSNLNGSQQRRVAEGLANPFFWAGIELLGSPW